MPPPPLPTRALAEKNKSRQDGEREQTRSSYATPSAWGRAGAAHSLDVTLPRDSGDRDSNTRFKVQRFPLQSWCAGEHVISRAGPRG